MCWVRALPHVQWTCAPFSLNFHGDSILPSTLCCFHNYPIKFIEQWKVKIWTNYCSELESEISAFMEVCVSIASILQISDHLRQKTQSWVFPKRLKGFLTSEKINSLSSPEQKRMKTQHLPKHSRVFVANSFSSINCVENPLSLFEKTPRVSNDLKFVVSFTCLESPSLFICSLKPTCCVALVLLEIRKIFSFCSVISEKMSWALLWPSTHVKWP